MLGSGTEGDPYIIQDVTDLQAVQNELDAYYELGNDIDASATSGWNGGLGFDPIGVNWQTDPFCGQFNGKNYTISSLFIDRPTTNFVGLFAASYPTVGKPGGLIKNVKMTSANITGQGLVGALIGDAYSDLENCNASGSVTGTYAVGGLAGYIYGDSTRCYSSCSVQASEDSSSAGGLAGYNAGLMTKSYATGNVTMVGSNNEIGGLVGWNGGTIEDCYARGSVSGDGYVGGLVGAQYFGSNAIRRSYSTGAVTGTGTIKGFCGYDDGAIEDCFWDTETSGQSTSDGGTGKTTAEMKSQDTFTHAGWAFNTIWGMTDGCNVGYPCLLDVTPYCTVIVPEVREDAIKDIVTLEALRNTEMMGLGRLYIDEEGKFKYESRFHRSV